MEREYLKNNICKFKPLFKINYDHKSDILSTCFFKMIGSGYKDFSIYVKGLIDLNNFITKIKSTYKIRLFIDNSIYNDKHIFNKILSLKNVQPILYSCPNYIINSDYHIGLFGTIVRFFPFFNFENNDANIVVSADIDGTNINIFEKYLKILRINKASSNIFNDIYLFRSGPLNRSLRFNFDIFYKGKLNPYFYAISFVSIKRIDKNILINFLKEVNKENNNIIYSHHYISENNKISKESDLKYKSHGKFIYGIDEYFLNTYLLNYIIDNKLCNVVNITWDIYGCLYYVLINDKSLTTNQIHLIDLIFEYIYNKLKLNFNNDESLKEKFDRLDRIIYSEKNKDKKFIYKINKLFYKLFLYFKNNKNYKFLYPSDYYKLFVDDDRYFGIYSIDLFRIIDCKKSDEDIVLEEHKFLKKDIEKLKIFYLKNKNN